MSKRYNSEAFRISVIYILVSVIYIYTSDLVVTRMFKDIQVIRMVSIFKGWAYVILSGILIYLLIKKFQKKRIETEERNLFLAEVTFEGLLIHRMGIVIDMNNAFSELFGYKRKEVIGKNLLDFFIEDDYREKFMGNTESNYSEPYEVVVNKKNGEKAWVEVIGKPVKHQGKKVRVIAIRDITKQKKTEETLIANESFLKSIIENGPQCIKILGEGGVLKYMNPSGLKMLDVDNLEMVKDKSVFPFILPDYKVAFEDLTKKVLRGEKGTLQFEMIGAKGKKLWLETHAVPLYNLEGKVESLLGITQDITDRKKFEDSLRDSEKKLFILFESVPSLVMLLDENSRIIKINSAGLNLTDLTEFHAIGKTSGQILNCRQLIDNSSICGVESECKNCTLQSSIQNTLSTKKGTYKQEGTIFMGKDENVFERNVLITTEYIEIDKKPMVFVNIDDITERVQMENILREKTAILLKAQEMAKIGEYQYDIRNQTFRLSKNLEKLSGYNKNIIPFDELLESIHPDDKELLLAKLEKSLNEDQGYILEFRRYNPDGEIQYFFTQAEIERNANGKPVKAFGVAMDITEQKKAELELLYKNYELQAAEEELIAANDSLRENLNALEEAKTKAEESDRLKSAFLANMSHEIRTPMNAIMGFAELLDLEDAPYERRKKFTKTIKERTKDLLNIVNDLLDISRIESHTLKIVETPGNINDILVEINEFYKIKNEEIYSKPIEFELVNELKGDQNLIETDFERIKQVLINMIQNAFKFTMQGSITVGCKLKDNNTLLFSVKDTGIGIPREKFNQIFERFRQGDDTYLTREFGGAGLGLSICKGIIELMNGKIWIDSMVDVGSTFYFTIPYKPINKIEEHPLVEPLNEYNFEGKTILIVEDIEYNREYLYEILRDSNANLIFAEDGVTALEKFQVHPEIDIVLMDIRLPDIHGFDLTKTMKEHRATLPIIAQSAYASDEDRTKGLEVGFNDYLTKPINQLTLLKMLNKYFSE